MDFGHLQKQALEDFNSLPDEGDELYKRYFVAMPFGKIVEQMSKSAAQVGTQNQVMRLVEKLQRKFDAIVWSNGQIVNEAKFVRVVGNDDKSLGGLEMSTKSSEDKLAAFLQAYSNRTVIINVPRGAKAKINLLFVNTSAPLPLRVIIDIGDEAELELFEYYASSTTEISLLGALHEVRFGKYSKSEINIVHNEDKNTNVTLWSKVKGEEHCMAKINFAYNGGTFTRAKNKVDVIGYEGNIEVNELIVGGGEQKLDISTNITNIAKSTNAVLESKAVLMDKSVCLLKGYAQIGKDASDSRSFVNERGILLDKSAHIDSIPSMSIGNSNVKATHSSATSPIDEESIFYLMSRGANENEAKKMVVNGFISGIIGKIDDIIVREIVASMVSEKITSRSFGTVPNVTTESMWLAGTAHSQGTMFKGHYKYKGE